ncbi:MAG: cysteine--tRNA ligase [Gammaproteobacteria bacterium]|nr:cysteine--tRNA ligase [Gammaproteobacteria bacterium]
MATALMIHNSFGGRKEEFRPIVPGQVRMYVCGITAYDYCHLGHGRMLVVFDMISRYLRARGFDLTYVRNITDIDDKIIKRAAENKESVDSLTARFIQAMDEDAAALGVLKPDREPRATQHIESMIKLIGRLENNGLAYRGANGDVYYDVSAFPGYGKLSGKHPDELRAGARVEVQEAKSDPLDFVLWKAAKPGEPSWDSPWGPGRPGWHIECSAMATQCLGEHFDIHGGGQDLQFPHHENEIAQSEGAGGPGFANYWMHNGFIRVAEEKMSKSLGNFCTIREVLAVYPAEVVRYFLLASHYRSPLNYANENLDEARAALTRLYTALRGCGESAVIDRDQDAEAEFHEAMADDFNTPRAIAVLHGLATRLNRETDRSSAAARRTAATLRHLGGILGLLQAEAEAFLKAGVAGEITVENIERKIGERAAARRAKNFTEADRIRDELLKQGVELSDGPAGTTWMRV